MIDLKDLMESQSATPPHQDELRYVQIQRRIVTRRRRRIVVTAVAAATAVAFIGGYAVIPALRTAPNPAVTPAPSAAPTPLFAQYDNGFRLVASNTAPITERKISLTWTPTTLDISFRVRCDVIPVGTDVNFEVTVNGRRWGAGTDSCDRLGIHGGLGWTEHYLLNVGQPATMVVTFSKSTARIVEVVPSVVSTHKAIRPPAAPWKTAPSSATPEAEFPTAGTASVAIYEAVPFEEYRFPSRPNQLVPLTSWAATCPNDQPDTNRQIIRSDPRDPLKPISLEVEWRGELWLNYQSQTPGRLHIAFNGTGASTAEWWDYHAYTTSNDWDTTSIWLTDVEMGWTSRPRKGDKVTLTLTPERFTGAWQFQVAHNVHVPCTTD